MSLTTTSKPVQIPLSFNESETWLPEILLIRFVIDECVEGIAGRLWRPIFESDCHANLDKSSFLSSEWVLSFLAISHRMSAGDIQFRRVHLNVGLHRRLVEVQLITHSLDESVILLRDVTQVARFRSHDEDSATLVALLSPREFEVLRLVVHGAPNKTIAASLDISAKTVEKHRTSIKRKTGTRNAAELIRRTYPVFNDSQEF